MNKQLLLKKTPKLFFLFFIILNIFSGINILFDNELSNTESFVISGSTFFVVTIMLFIYFKENKEHKKQDNKKTSFFPILFFLNLIFFTGSLLFNGYDLNIAATESFIKLDGFARLPLLLILFFIPIINFTLMEMIIEKKLN